MSSLKGKVALVTGAGSKRGMGYAIALRLAGEGADVAVVDKHSAPKSLYPGDEGWGGLDTVVSEIETLGQKALAVVADISNSQDVDTAVAKTVEKFGKIDILVHAAAIRGSMKLELAMICSCSVVRLPALPFKALAAGAELHNTQISANFSSTSN